MCVPCSSSNNTAAASRNMCCQAVLISQTSGNINNCLVQQVEEHNIATAGNAAQTHLVKIVHLSSKTAASMAETVQAGNCTQHAVRSTDARHSIGCNRSTSSTPSQTTRTDATGSACAQTHTTNCKPLQVSNRLCQIMACTLAGAHIGITSLRMHYSTSTTTPTLVGHTVWTLSYTLKQQSTLLCSQQGA